MMFYMRLEWFRKVFGVVAKAHSSLMLERGGLET